MKQYSVMFEALLLGHDDWVYGVAWEPLCVKENGEWYQPLSLLSASADKSMMVWQPDASSSVWVNNVRVGELGGNTTGLGFYGCVWGPKGQLIGSHDCHGAWHIWKQETDKETGTVDWIQQIAVSGHYASVQDLAWDPESNYLLTVSLDQTTRLHSTWVRPDTESKDVTRSTWHEIGRPQIHGYDLHCLDFVDKYRIASGADEKVLRVFEAPRNVVESIANISKLNIDMKDKMQRPLGASVPALGLSNKAVFDEHVQKQNTDSKEHRDDVHAANTATALNVASVSTPPVEEYLVQHTLWPEADKLYGHGFELISIASSHDGSIVASACKAAKPEHAVIRLWDTKTWKEIRPPLAAHTLTVTDIKFSYDDQWMVSVGRDRQWSLFRKVEGQASPYQLVCSNAKAHARIIWSCSWSIDNKYFVTGSRDKSIKIWSKTSEDGSSWDAVKTIKFEEAVTAVDFAPVLLGNGKYVLAVGLETGDIIVKHSEDGGLNWNTIATSTKEIAHNGSINAMKWRRKESDGQRVLQLATCGDDHSVRIYSVGI